MSYSPGVITCRHPPSARRILAFGAAVVALCVLPATNAESVPVQNGCNNRTNNTYSKLLECVRLDGVRGIKPRCKRSPTRTTVRVRGDTGYNASVDYVVEHSRPRAGT